MPHEPAPAERVVLVVDLDGQPLVPLRTLEEILLALGQWEDDDRADPPERDPLWLPEPLADGRALAAVQRLLAALAPTQSLGPDRGRLLGPDGIYEHAPMTALRLLAADVDTLSLCAQALGHPGLPGFVVDLVEDYARTLAVDPYARARIDRPAFVAQVARVAGLLDLAATEDTRLLVDRLTSSPPHLDLALTTEEEAAYQRTADRMNAMLADRSGIERLLY